MQYGFRDECMERCGADGDLFWEKINQYVLQLYAPDILCRHSVQALGDVNMLPSAAFIGSGCTH